MARGKWRWIATGVLLVAGGTALATLAYPRLAVYAAPRKLAQPADGVEASRAREAFWAAFQSQRYEALPELTEALTAAYLDNPADPRIALLLAHAHLWKVSERARGTAGARITDELVLANFYFREAYKLQPDDHRIAGWLASTELALASIHQDERNRRRGYFMLRQSARDAPEFNHFTLGYVLSRLPAGDPRLQEAVESMWSALDACLDRAVDRRDPDVSSLGAGAVPAGPKRVCFNGPYTPHNVEGFFLAFGDLLLKTGDPALARTIYGKAKEAPTYESWPFKATLEERMQSAHARSARFATGGEPAPETIGTSAHACAICHAR